MPLAGRCGKYRSWASLRPSVAVTMPMLLPGLTSENNTWFGAIHVSPEALRSQDRASPLKAGTIDVSHVWPAPFTVYAMRAPSGENTGLIFWRVSCVSGLGSPLGSNLM